MQGEIGPRKRIAVVGTGISGMSAAWLLSQSHDVTVYEQDGRPGGHSNTVEVSTPDGMVPVDTGFIVYNEKTYPNLTALFSHLDVPTHPSEMSFAVSLEEGELEYSGSSLNGLFAQRSNVFRPRFWSMLGDLWRFYREAPRDLSSLDDLSSLEQYLDAGTYGEVFRSDHLLPMAAAIWSSSPSLMLQYPAASFIRFHDNHGLLRLRNRPQWRTVVGGSRTYVDALTRRFRDRIRLAQGVAAIRRRPDGVEVRDCGGHVDHFDEVVIAAHADQALALLDEPTAEERSLLGAFRYSQNRAVLHSDPVLMPQRKAAWASWNYIGGRGPADTPTVTYWMNALQRLPTAQNLFVTLNPLVEPRQVLHEQCYEHPIFDAEAMSAQRRLWSLQGRDRLWFCGSYFGAGFHEDGLQSGLAVAETLGGVRRPWRVENESGRIYIDDASCHQSGRLAA
ncbi:NAD(P)/FAD-dependent oxidoreductase [Bradyrhizobium cosmicum]|uniref:Amine oxidase n=1 Tax=Bradyrhizobium cosmicum TaxID=1404864 RepID=A0AAI8MDP0_9BRAD|nr:NAD(P)/FAD-dependent oxidoreductase [Bradyrhizobium cosmicum]QDP26498.1 NAD(P)/FAD-dependent oxidoreductase [Bradyrhizobium cosmicum]BAL76517.1 putative amine oxidase [Bradyrhizobium cosmicum]